ncbi:hypothetical protein S1361_36460 [Streptomyces cyanogenus]|uniref:Uncharacterized protein n=1 Tax=Streptomyces cyanogenus TaxID=80860 RepID=A0ABX7U465_STRCY|nr:hypothetical protein S1361_36460 [Streptomyces cyanogenus]
MHRLAECPQFRPVVVDGERAGPDGVWVPEPLGLPGGTGQSTVPAGRAGSARRPWSARRMLV